MPSVASPLSSSSCPAWHRRCFLPHARHGIVACHLPHARGGISVVVFLTPIVALSLVIFLMHGVASPLTSSSCPGWHLRCRLPHTRRGIVACRLPQARRGISVDVFLMPGVALSLSSSSHSLWHCRVSSSSCPAWRIWRYSVPLTTAVSVRGGVPFCPVQPSVCAVVFSALPGVDFGMRVGLLFHSARHTRWCSVLSGVAFGMCGGPLFHSA